jgi:hypothetical protein
LTFLVRAILLRIWRVPAAEFQASAEPNSGGFFSREFYLKPAMENRERGLVDKTRPKEGQVQKPPGTNIQTSDENVRATNGRHSVELDPGKSQAILKGRSALLSDKRPFLLYQ